MKVINIINKNFFQKDLVISKICCIFAHFFTWNGPMNNSTQHITNFDSSVDAGVMNLLESMGQFANGVKMMYGRCVEEKEQYRQQAEANHIEPSNVVAEGMQGELIAIANALHARGMFTCSKKELMERLGQALGCPGLADYSRPLNKIKQANKYEDIFDNLREVAIQERDKND